METKWITIKEPGKVRNKKDVVTYLQHTVQLMIILVHSPTRK
jgi:hypothetical protein